MATRGEIIAAADLPVLRNMKRKHLHTKIEHVMGDSSK